MSNRSRQLAACMLVSACLTGAALLAGCSLDQDKDKKTKAVVSTKPAPEDRLRTRNDDILYGRLEGDSFTIDSPYFKPVTLQRSEIREIAFEGDQDVIRTRGRDVVRGRLAKSTFRFKARIGVEKDFARTDLKWIELRN